MTALTRPRAADWVPGDVLPGYSSYGHHVAPMFKLKYDHECPVEELCDEDDWILDYSAMHWSPVPQESDRPCA